MLSTQAMYRFSTPIHLSPLTVRKRALTVGWCATSVHQYSRRSPTGKLIGSCQFFSSAKSPGSAEGSTTFTHFKDTPSFQRSLPDPPRPHEDWCLFHPVYKPEELTVVKVVRHQPKDISDRIVAGLIRLVRFGFDTVTRYKAPPENHVSDPNMSLEDLRAAKLVMTPQQWLARILFLESIAGVPGMVAAMLRHFKSLRMCGRDGGWIRTLLEEAENERMHLLTFMKIKQPTMIFRALVLGAQGVFANLFFLAYVISPRSAHRFVGMLEEEAVFTYTSAIRELESGLLPEWENMPAPQIAIDYWRMSAEAKMIDLLYAVRADEANHRFVNHSLANLDATNFNPFAIKQPDGIVRGTKPGLERPELEAWAKKVEDEYSAEKKLINAPTIHLSAQVTKEMQVRGEPQAVP